MQRVTITLSDDIADALDALMSENGAGNRSEAIRDLIRRAMTRNHDGVPEQSPCLGVASYTVDQSVRSLGARLAQRRLDGHDRHVAALSIPLDHTTALEVEVTRGPLGVLVSAAEALFLERGVAHGSLSLIPVDEEDRTHVHAHDPASRPHSHLTVKPGFPR
ncbi:MAG: nickel-responsive transcriptional regulator NikR [Yangia sp.]|nr:nickel-responsive transcriptional regulator NikR [Salipiger sp.]